MKQAIIENLQRSDLNPIEEARAYHQLLTKLGMTHEALAQVMGKSRPYISNSLRLLNLSDQATEALVAKTISPGHARLLLSYSPKEQNLWLQQVLAKDWTVRQLEQAIKEVPKKPKPANPFIREQEVALKKALGLTSTITLSGKEKGSLTIKFDSLDDFHNLVHKLLEGVDKES